MLNPLIARAVRRRQMLYPVFWMSDQLDRTFWLASVAALPRSEPILEGARGTRLRGVSPLDRRPCPVVAPGRCRKSARALKCDALARQRALDGAVLQPQKGSCAGASRFAALGWSACRARLVAQDVGPLVARECAARQLPFAKANPAP